jgi:exopolysaccharide biosynthesis polyprenyl glycosylphosphotransferase
VKRGAEHAMSNDRRALARVRPASAQPADLLPEAVFLRALSLERKRAERSGRRFVLMLLEPGGALDNGHRPDPGLRDKAVSAILVSIRETDIAGWHVTDHVLGVIFTEIGPAALDVVLAALQEKTAAALASVLPAEQVKQVRVAFHCFPESGDVPANGRGTIVTLYPDLVQRDAARKMPRFVKRLIDILGSALALIIFAPVFVIIAAAIKLSSPGPILFRQERIGQFGVPFTFLKFRSMYVCNDPTIHRDFVQQFINGKPSANGGNGHTVFKITHDPRVTPVGRFLRRTSLDELPQFINALRGDMSLVGPRPPIQYELEAYRVWHRRRLLEVKPGITGLWQVTGRSRLSFDDMVRLDLKYAKAWSLWLDLKILLRTPRAVISREGAY